MIRILFHIDELSAGGAERVLCNLVNSMNQDKFAITVYTTYKCDHKKFLKDGIRYKYVYEKQNRLNRFIYRLEAELGIFYRLHLKGEYDIEVAYLECGPTKVMAASTNKNAKKIAWIHCDLEKKAKNIIDFTKKTLPYYNCFDRIVCVSEECRNTFIKYFGNENKIIVLHNTIDELEIQKKAQMFPKGLEESKKRFTAVTMGRMTSQKNLIMLLQCHKILLDNNYKHDLWLIGDGEDMEMLQDYVKKNALQNSVTFWGYQHNPYCILKYADLYVCTSRYEGYSTSVIEAMVLGVPVLTTKCTGMTEILENSVCGMIVENDTNSFIQGFKKLFLDSELIIKLSKKALERGKELSGKKNTEKTEVFFEELLSMGDGDK